MKFTGQFSWSANERRSDRYGGIMLTGPHDEQGDKTTYTDLLPARQFVGRRVTITARVTETRASYHIGDLFRGISPSTPKVGWVAELGTGLLVDVEQVGPECIPHILFRRDELAESADDWMDPHILYKLHHQTVELSIEPAGVT